MKFRGRCKYVIRWMHRGMGFVARVSPTCRGRVLRCVQVKRIRRGSGDSTDLRFFCFYFLITYKNGFIFNSVNDNCRKIIVSRKISIN